eukprot:g36023.t1
MWENTMSSLIMWPTIKATRSISKTKIWETLALLHSLRDCRTIQALRQDLRYNNLSVKTAQLWRAAILAEFLKDHPSVTSVDLRDNNLSVESGSALASVIH